MKTSESDWFSHKTIAPGLTHISDGGEDSIYLFEGESQAVLFDTGFGLFDLAAYVGRLTDKPLDVFQTHGHPDHAMGCYQFPEVRMHAADIPMCREPMPEEEVGFIRDRFFGGSFPQTFPLEKWRARRPYPVPLDRDSYEYDDFRIDVIHTPGHTRGQVAYHIRPFGYLIVGDTLVHATTWMQLPESTDLETYRLTLTLIAEVVSAVADERGGRAGTQVGGRPGETGTQVGAGALVFCGHSPEPIPARIIQRFPAFVAAVQRGEVPGTWHDTFVGGGNAYVLEEPYGILVKEASE
jgi:glyoxylase-like metal-dependent hydrolase (beta-lactamase superfamily II)